MTLDFGKKCTALMVILLVIVIFLSGCSRNKTPALQLDNIIFEKPIVEIEMSDGEKMILELYPEFAPETVQNFVNLAHSGFYDGLIFHRVIKDFMIQSGDPKGTGTGGAKLRIDGEFADNGFTQNTLKHTRGTISMARSPYDPNSANSQFFIMHEDGASLDGNYAAFGMLIEGEELLDKIANSPVGPNNKMKGEISKPKKSVVIKKVIVYEKDEE